MFLVFLLIHLFNGEVVPIFGNYSEFFMYYTKLTVGSQNLEFTVVLDTGSSDLLIPNVGCTTCAGDPSGFYAANESKTSWPVPCNNPNYQCSLCDINSRQCMFVLSFVGISETCLFAYDDVQVGSTNVFSPFGGIIQVNMSASMKKPMRAIRPSRRSPFLTPLRDDDDYPEGVWGLAYNTISVPFGAETYFDMIVKTTGIHNLLSMCFHSSGIGGMLFLGEIQNYFRGAIRYTPIIKEKFYNILLQDVLVNTVSLGLSPKIYNTENCIVDTGTPTVTFPPAVIGKLKLNYLANCSSNWLKGVCDVPTNATIFDGVCFNLSTADILAYPTITFVMYNNESGPPATVLYPPSAYIRPLAWICDGAAVSLAIQSDPSGFGSVLGMSALQGYYTVYDRANGRVGFAPSLNCPNK